MLTVNLILSAATCMGTAFQVQGQEACFKTTKLPDAVVHVPGACIPWHCVQTLILTVYANRKNCNLCSDMHNLHFYLGCPACLLRLSWVFCRTSAGSYEHFRSWYKTTQYMPDELPKLRAEWIASAIRTLWEQLQGDCSWKHKRTKLRYYSTTIIILKLSSNKVSTQLYYETLQLSSNSKSPSSHRG